MATTSAATTCTEPERRTRAISPIWICVLGLLTAVSPLSTDMYLPGFPQLAADLGVSSSAVQLTLTAFMVGLGLGQLVIGPLSDRFGRRLPLLIGTTVCALASAACAVAPTITVLVVFRFVQGFSGAAGVVLSRAVISDRATGTAVAKTLSVLMMINGVAPVIAPLLGSLLLPSIGWRGVFWVLAGVAVLMFIGVTVWITETHPADRRHTGGLSTLTRNGVALLGDRRFVGYTLVFSFNFAVLFAYISASPFVLQNRLGLSQFHYSLVFSSNAVGLILVSALNARLVERFGQRRLLLVAAVLLPLTAAGLLIDALVGPAMWPTLILLWCTVSSMGLMLPNAASLAIQQSRHSAGTGSAILGALQFVCAGTVAPLVGIAGERSALPMAITMVTAAALAAAALATTPRTAQHAG